MKFYNVVFHNHTTNSLAIHPFTNKTLAMRKAKGIANAWDMTEASEKYRGGAMERFSNYMKYNRTAGGVYFVECIVFEYEME